MLFRSSGSLRRSARALAAAAVVSSGMMAAGRAGAASDPPSSTASEVPAAAPVASPITTTTMPSPTPMERQSLLPLAQPLWTELSRAQQQTLAPFAAEWNIWPAAEKRSWVSLSDRMPSMAPEKRQKMTERIIEWARLTPEERQTARDNYRLAKERSADIRANAWERYRSMTQEQRSVLREAGTTSNTAAGHAGSPSGLAKEAAQPLPRSIRKPWHGLTPDQRPSPDH